MNLKHGVLYYALMAYSNSGSDTEREQFGDASIEIQAYTQALKKVEAQLKLEKKEELKAKVEKWHNSSKNLNILLTSQMSARDKAGLGSSDIEDSSVNDRYAEGMHAVLPPMIGIYIPSGPDVEIDESYEETLTSMPEPVVYVPKVVSQPKVWSDAPIIEEYESDSDDKHVSLPTKEQETPSFAFVNTVKHVKTPRQTIKEQNTCSQNPKPDKKDCNGLMSKKLGLGYGFTKKACFVCGSFSHLIRDCDFHEKRIAKQVELNKRMCKGTRKRENKPVWNNAQRVNHQNQFVPKALLTKTARIPVNTARASTLENKGIVDSGCSRHLTGNKAYLAEYQDYNGGPVAFGGSKGYITGKGKIKTGKLDFEDVCFVKELHHFNLFSVSQMCDKKNKVLFTDTEIFNLENIVPSGGLACLIAKATVDESNKWHRRLGLVNFKNLNKLVKGNLPVRSENQAYKHAGPKEANHSVAQKQRMKVKKPNKSNEKLIDHEDQAFLEELERLKSQEKEANDAAEALRKEFAQDTEDLLLQAGVARASSTNTVNTASTPVSTASPSGGLSYTDLTNSDQDDTQIPALEDSYDNPNDDIFTNASYDDEGAVVDFTNLETIMNVSPIPRSRIHSVHPSTQILGDLKLAIQTRSKVNKSSGAHAFKTIGTKWVYRNKKDERGVMVRNKARLVDQGHRQEEGIDYDEAFALVARIEAIRIFLAFASYMGFIVYQMDVKSVFLYGIIDEEDKYVAEILKKFDFASVKTASTPIETQKPLVKDEEATDVDVHLYRSMIGSLMYLTASRPDIMFVVCACSRFQVTPKTSHLNAVKRIFRYLKGKPKLGLWYPRVSSFDLEAYSDSDYAGANLDRKSTTGGCQFLGRRLISWQCKKQTIVATSTIEAEYVAAANCCGQVLWIQNQMLDYGFNFINTKIYIDNKSTICIVKNLVFHSKTKHIEIRHHFIKDAYEKKLIQVLKIHTDDNVADLLTKSFDVSRDGLGLGPSQRDMAWCSNKELWTSAKSRTVNNISYIDAIVAGKPVTISEASIRSDLLFDDIDEIDTLNNQAIFDTIQLMGLQFKLKKSKIEGTAQEA
ncbi:ribonuclease H-like domain-containing protein [Tanacetum coccineum]